MSYAADFILWISMALAATQMASGFFGDKRFSRAAAITLFLCLTFAFGSLIYSFATSDFSLQVVYQNSHTLKPLIYKISGTWGNHEGSLLMLTWILTLYGFFYARSDFNPRALAVQGLICLLFTIFMKFTSNPFAPTLTPFTHQPFTPENGLGLNPLLQDIGLAIHPPVLYLGYVGFSLVFSIAVGYLLEGNITREYARTSRLWCVIAWSFLTLGIGLGSWWAYRELGWGGFWFWDPVENCSLMPWLAGTALMHSLIITDKRKTLKRWTILLSILTFGLSLSGFFLVRSGVLSSVHSFANDPARGMMILAIMGTLMGFALVVYALRAHKLKSIGEYDFLSRETAILFNNLLLTVLCATVFIGTTYPLILNALSGEVISVGAPFYAATFIPGGIAVIYLCATATLGKWKRNEFKKLLKRLSAPLSVPKIVSLGAYFFYDYTEFQALILFAGLYLLFAVIWEFQHKRNWDNLPMIIAHGGVAVMVLGILLATTFPKKVETAMHIKDKIHLADFDVSLDGVKEDYHDNYAYRRAEFNISKHGKHITFMEPEMRVYKVEQSSTTEAAIFNYNFVSNLYIIIGEKDPSGAYAVRAYYKPFINLIWAGCLIMFCGGILRVFVHNSRSRRILERMDAKLLRHHVNRGGGDDDDE